jgi:hypothetical protein
VNATCLSYVDGSFSSNCCAYSFGTGEVIGMTIAPAARTAVACLKWKTSVWSSGVSIPEIGR